MTKTVFNFQIDNIYIPLEGLKVKYRLLPAGEKPKKKKKTDTNKVYLEVESVLYNNRDVRFLFDDEVLNNMAVNDYYKTTNGTMDEQET